MEEWTPKEKVEACWSKFDKGFEGMSKRELRHLSNDLKRVEVNELTRCEKAKMGYLLKVIDNLIACMK